MPFLARRSPGACRSGLVGVQQVRMWMASGVGEIDNDLDHPSHERLGLAEAVGGLERAALRVC